MPMKTSNRVVIEVDPAQKQQIYAALKARGLTMREWFLQQVSQELPFRSPPHPPVSRATIKYFSGSRADAQDSQAGMHIQPHHSRLPN